MDAAFYVALSVVTLLGLVASIAGYESRDGFDGDHGADEISDAPTHSMH